MKNIAKNKTVLLTSIVLLGLILRVIRILEMNRYDLDCYLYFNMAIDWAKYGADYVYSNDAIRWIPPLLPFLMSIGCKLGIQPEITGTFVGILLGVLIPPCMFYIVNILFKRSDLALLAAFLGAIHPSLVRISVRCLRDSLYIPLVAIALVCAIAAIKNRSVFKWCLFSTVAALASLARYEGSELILIFLLWLSVEIVATFVSSLRRRTTNHKPQTNPFPSTNNYQPSTRAKIKHYCYSFLLVMIIFFSLNLYVSSQIAYKHTLLSIIKLKYK